MTTIAPNKVVLTCNVTGKSVTWTNRSIIQKKIDQFGSLEAFSAQFTCKGAKKKEKQPSAVVIKPILVQGVEMGKMSKEEYTTKYVTNNYQYKDGGHCTVVSPKVVSA